MYVGYRVTCRASIGSGNDVSNLMHNAKAAMDGKVLEQRRYVVAQAVHTNGVVALERCLLIGGLQVNHHVDVKAVRHSAVRSSVCTILKLARLAQANRRLKYLAVK